MNFIDAQEMHNQNPDTFWVPSDEELSNITAGDHIKVAVNAERFWIKVESVEGNEIMGTCANETVDFKFGEKISVKKRNVYQIEKQNVS